MMDLLIKSPAALISTLRNLLCRRIRIAVSAAFSDVRAASVWSATLDSANKPILVASIPFTVYAMEQPFIESVCTDLFAELKRLGWFAKYSYEDGASELILFLSDSEFRDDDQPYEEQPEILPAVVVEEVESDMETDTDAEDLTGWTAEETAIESESDMEVDLDDGPIHDLIDLLPPKLLRMIDSQTDSRLAMHKGELSVIVSHGENVYSVNGNKCLSAKAAASFVANLLKD